MAHGDKKHSGETSLGKRFRSGAMTELDRDGVGESEILSNRDKKQHSNERGQDHAANRR